MWEVLDDTVGEPKAVHHAIIFVTKEQLLIFKDKVDSTACPGRLNNIGLGGCAFATDHGKSVASVQIIPPEGELSGVPCHHSSSSMHVQRNSCDLADSVVPHTVFFHSFQFTFLHDQFTTSSARPT